MMIYMSVLRAMLRDAAMRALLPSFFSAQRPVLDCRSTPLAYYAVVAFTVFAAACLRRCRQMLML